MFSIRQKHNVLFSEHIGRLAAVGIACNLLSKIRVAKKSTVFASFQPGDACNAAVKCEIKGTFPGWLNGCLFRNGPGLFDFKDGTFRHWFDGMAVIHKYTFQDGQVSYQNHLLESENLKQNIAAQRVVTSSFGTVPHPDPCKSLFSRYFSYYKDRDLNDNDVVSILLAKDQVYAQTENDIMTLIDDEKLSVIGKVPVGRLLSVHMKTAHPHAHTDGTVINLGSHFAGQSYYVVFKMKPKEKGSKELIDEVQLLAKIPAQFPRKPAYFHSFGITDKYALLLEGATVVNVPGLALGKLTPYSFMDWMSFKQNSKSRIHIVDLSSGEVLPIKLTTPPTFTFHHVNAYQVENLIIMDLIGHSNMDIIPALLLENIRAFHTSKHKPVPLSKLYRFVFPVSVPEGCKEGDNIVTFASTEATATVQPDGSIHCVPDIYESDFELPRINYAFNGKKYSFVYGTTFLREDANKLVKMNVETRKQWYWIPETDMLPGEPVFIKGPVDQGEDDGVIVSPISSNNPSRPSYLIALDARAFTELGRAEIPLHYKVPATFHGDFKRNTP